jgi:hypothetical protein
MTFKTPVSSSSVEKSVASGLHQAWSHIWSTACRACPLTANNLMDLAGLLLVVVVVSKL